VKPTIAVSTAVITALQGNSGTAIGVGVLGDAGALLAQGSGLNLSTYLANFAL
jgi:hypothetical protein